MREAAQLFTYLALAGLTLAALHDVAVRTVPNVLICAIGVFALIVAAAQHRLLPSASIALVLFAVTALLCLRGYLGGADAKLLTASALLVVPHNVLAMLLATALAGGLLSIPYIPGKRLFSRPAPGRATPLPSRLIRCEIWRLHRGGPLPYAVAIAAGTAVALMHGS